MGLPRDKRNTALPDAGRHLAPSVGLALRCSRAALVATVLVTLALVVPSHSAIAAHARAATAPHGLTFVGQLRVGTFATGIASDGSHAWETDLNSGDLTEIDPVRHAVVGAPIHLGNGLYAVSSDGVDVWVVNVVTDQVIEVDAATRAVVGDPIAIQGEPYAISADGTHVWVTSQGGGAGSGLVTDIDAANQQVVATISIQGAYAIWSDGADVWVGGGTISDYFIGTLTELDAATGALVRPTISLPREPGWVSSNGRDVWVLYNDSALLELDAATAATVATPLVSTPSYLAGVVSDGQHAWAVEQIANSAESDVLEIDPSGSEVGPATFVGDDSPYFIATDGARVWLLSTQGRLLEYQIPLPSLSARVAPFAFDSAHLGPVVLAACHAVAAELSADLPRGYDVVTLTGYTAPGGDTTGQRQLSMLRALLVRRCLRNDLADPSLFKFKVRAGGAATGSNNEGPVFDRRVDVTIAVASASS